jgi:hypothetical protein
LLRRESRCVQGRRTGHRLSSGVAGREFQHAYTDHGVLVFKV